MEFSRCARRIASAGLKDGKPPEGGQSRSLKTQQSRSSVSTYSRRAPRSGRPRAITTGAPAAVSAAAFPRKEVIQPQLPLRLPCYDFTPITDSTFGRCLQKVGARTSGVSGFRGVTGGVYKARERIHRDVADPRLLATPTS